MVALEHPLLTSGLYEVSDAVRIVRADMRLVGVHDLRSRETVRRWISGYCAEDGTHARDRVAPLVTGDQLRVGDRQIVTFADLIELHFVAAFRNEGVSAQTLRRAAAHATQLWGNTHPFSTLEFRTDGKRVFAEETYRQGVGGLPTAFTQELVKGQYVFAELVQPFFRRISIEADGRKRLWPLGRSHTVVLDPASSFGRPIDAESGVPTQVLADAARREGVPAAANWYEVSERAVRDAVAYEETLREP